MSWYIDDPRDRFVILLGLALVEFFLKSREFEGYPPSVKYEILEWVATLTERLTNVMPRPPVRYDAYGNPHQ